MVRSRQSLSRCVVLAGVLLVSAGLGGASAQITRHTYVTAVDNQGQPVVDMAAADFRVRENNRDRDIVSVDPATERMRIALMVEETLTPLGGVRQGLFEFAKVMVDKAEMSIVVVGLSNRTAVPYTTDLGALVAGINDLPLSQRQDVNHVPEGIGDMARVFVKDRAERPVIVMIALDIPQASREQPQNVLNVLRDSNAQLHVVSIQAPQGAADVSGAASVMEAAGRAQVLGDGPRQSGGRQWPINALTGVPGAMVSIAGELSNQYKITYTLPAGTKPSDRLNITTNRRGVTLRAPTRVWVGQ